MFIACRHVQDKLAKSHRNCKLWLPIALVLNPFTAYPFSSLPFAFNPHCQTHHCSREFGYGCLHSLRLRAVPNDVIFTSCSVKMEFFNWPRKNQEWAVPLIFVLLIIFRKFSLKIDDGKPSIFSSRGGHIRRFLKNWKFIHS